MEITLNVPNDLAARLNTVQDKIPQILEFGLRELDAASQTDFSGLSTVLEFLAGLPTPEETLALNPSESLQAQIEALLEKNRTTGLTPEEERFWKSYEYAEHLVRIAKTKAYIKLHAAQ